MSFSQKVNRLLRESGMTKSDLARESGIPYTTLDSMLKRETDTARLAGVFRIARALGTTVEALVFDEGGEVGLKPEEQRILELYSLLDERGKDTVLSLLEKEADISRAEEPVYELPVFDAPAAAGNAMPVLTEEKSRLYYRKGEIPRGAAFGIRISGDSMEPIFYHGDLVYVDPSVTISSGEIGVFLLNGESLCKRYVYQDGKTLLVSENAKYAPISVLDTDEMRLVGKVVIE